jgi:hypothetical protein
MTSAINPNNIDGSYPVAGQDNDSQGFRDNFTNIKTNFERAKNEITDLQFNAVLKAPLTGQILNNNMNGSVLSNAQLRDISETRIAPGAVSGNYTLNYEAGPYYSLSTDGSISLAFQNFPAAGTVGRVRLQINVTNLSHTLTLPITVNVGTNNIQGLSNNIITFNQLGTYEFEFETSDGGASISIFDLNRNHDPIYLPSVQLLSTAGNISTTVTTTVITSSVTLSGNLAAGSEGQVKVIAYGNTSVGNATINVTNAAWASNEEILLTTTGSAVTLQYINGKWYCIGNNGASFS